MLKGNEKYRKEYLELIKRHIVRRLIGAAVFVVIGAILLGIAYLGYKNVIKMEEFYCIMTGFCGACSIGFAVVRLTHYTHSEYNEMEEFKLIQLVRKIKDIDKEE